MNKKELKNKVEELEQQISLLIERYNLHVTQLLNDRQNFRIREVVMKSSGTTSDIIMNIINVTRSADKGLIIDVENPYHPYRRH